jgi:hypothetical protein
MGVSAKRLARPTGRLRTTPDFFSDAAMIVG